MLSQLFWYRLFINSGYKIGTKSGISAIVNPEKADLRSFSVKMYL